MSPSLLVEKNGSVPNAILSLLTVSTNDTTRIDSALAVSCLLFERESNVNNQKLMGPFDTTKTESRLLTSFRSLD
jgi:hypothetical protein